MLKRIWQWLKGLFRRLFGTSPHYSTPPSFSFLREDEAPPLADSDYEYLFRQLLEGITHGWQQERVVRWFEGMQERTPLEDWAEWLQRFGERVLASPAPNNELATRLVQLGEQTLSVPSLTEIGEVAHNIGAQLLDRNPSEPIWEFDGPDFLPEQEENATTLIYEGGESANPEAAATETITLDELLERLQQDPTLVQLLAQQMGVETTDPQVIIEALINQFNTANQEAATDAESWFSQGVQQDEAGDLEAAIASYDKALEIQPDLYEVWFNRGNVLAKLERFDQAIYAYDKAVEIKPNFREAWHNRGNVLSHLQRWEESNASYEKANSCHSDDNSPGT